MTEKGRVQKNRRGTTTGRGQRGEAEGSKVVMRHTLSMAKSE